MQQNNVMEVKDVITIYYWNYLSTAYKSDENVLWDIKRQS